MRVRALFLVQPRYAMTIFYNQSTSCCWVVMGATEARQLVHIELLRIVALAASIWLLG